MDWNAERSRILHEVSRQPGGLEAQLVALTNYARQGADPDDVAAVRRELVADHERSALR